MLINKEGLWISDEAWNFKIKNDLVYIENISKAKVLEATIDGEVIFEDFKENKAEQLWKKVNYFTEGYFTLENFKVPKVMTANSSSILQIEGIKVRTF